eukprot:5407412-Ditylum_brightwellii.AAC.1
MASSNHAVTCYNNQDVSCTHTDTVNNNKHPLHFTTQHKDTPGDTHCQTDSLPKGHDGTLITALYWHN